MADAAGRIGKLVVRCPCGKSSENAERYLEHKRLCGTHRKEENIKCTTPGSNQRLATNSARASVSASSPKPIACWCGRTFKNQHALRKHGCDRVVQKQQLNAHSASLVPYLVSELNSGADSEPAAGEQLLPLAKVTAKKIQCPCGQRFSNEKALSKHLRYSKTHQAGRLGSASMSKAQTSGSVWFTASHSSPTSVPPASGPLPGTIPSSMLSPALLIPCTCGHVFETQRILDLHKRDSSIHNQQAIKSLAQCEQWDDSLVSSFTSLSLESVSTQLTPSIARFVCMCGRVFTNQRSLEQHKRDTGRHTRQENGERKAKIFRMPPPQYQVDEYLRDMAAIHARQYCDKE